MAKRSKTPERIADERALLRRYQHDLDKIRREYISALGRLDLDEAALALRIQAREAESDYKVLSRKFRSEVSTLRKKGLVSKKVVTSKARPTRYLRNVVDTFRNVITGRSKVTKLKPAAAKRLKSEGFLVKNNRLVSSPNMSVNRTTGVVTRVKGVHVIDHIVFDENIEEQVREIWDSLGRDEVVSYEIFGNMARVYNQGPGGFNDFMLALLRYGELQGDARVSEAHVMYFPTRIAANAAKSEREVIKFDRQEANRRRRQRERRARKRGVRTSRGN